MLPSLITPTPNSIDFAVDSFAEQGSHGVTSIFVTDHCPFPSGSATGTMRAINCICAVSKRAVSMFALAIDTRTIFARLVHAGSMGTRVVRALGCMPMIQQVGFLGIIYPHQIKFTKVLPCSFAGFTGRGHTAQEQQCGCFPCCCQKTPPAARLFLFFFSLLG